MKKKWQKSNKNLCKWDFFCIFAAQICLFVAGSSEKDNIHSMFGALEHVGKCPYQAHS